MNAVSQKQRLLSRDEFRAGVFARDRECVLCRAHGRCGPAVDAHHILERRLFPDGGYYLDNGAALCADHHAGAETTEFSVEEVREAAGITARVLPNHLYPDQKYDKWGNPVLQNGQRMRGELFYDESVQRALGRFLRLFTSRVKYPRTYHLPWSPGVGKGDRVVEDMDQFLPDTRVVVTEKFDGENTTLYPDGLHARSLEYHTDVKRDWVRAFHASIAHDIPDGMRVCGENLFAVHSIHYQALPSYFLGFSVWARDICLSWDSTVEWLRLLGIQPVSVLFDGPYGEFLEHLEDHAPAPGAEREREGYVVRLAGEFQMRDFRRCAAKYVRDNHVQTSEHWLRKPLEKNGLAE